ncbi:MAG: bifunctional hydroxymethylpyrimidine kinase/phosphomethylpyrimidine kinase [Treponema sp.]|nr:bifunctional hydroxymethylpyrimidine kinase/phosphomethylpyrimidine kinase [Treponema sp.]
MKTALTIAGSDSCGGAGIQADIKTMTMNGVYAMSAVTALTAQNTTGVTQIMEVTPDFLKAQLDAVITDIFPDAVKTGMVASSELIKTIAAAVKSYSIKNLVVDPVMVATSGSKLISEEAIDTLKKELLPLARVITPNIPEAEVLLENSGLSALDSKALKITSEFEMEEAARKIHEKFGCSVLVKGGHNVNDASDFLYGRDENGEIVAKWFKGRRISNPNTHGTGCTLSSAIAANLAKGESLEKAVEKAKEYISGALEAMLDLGKGSGPLMHNFALNS